MVAQLYAMRLATATTYFGSDGPLLQTYGDFVALAHTTLDLPGRVYDYSVSGQTYRAKYGTPKEVTLIRFGEHFKFHLQYGGATRCHCSIL
jgi:hypothetical protein